MDIAKIILSLPTNAYSRGQWLFREGDSGNGCLYFLAMGQIDIVKKLGDRTQIINSMKPGAIFGEMAIVRDIARTAGALVTSETASVASIDKSTFLRLSDTNPEFLFYLLRSCIDRIIHAEERLNEHLKKTE